MTTTDLAPPDVSALRAENEQLRAALDSRDVIGQAKGIIRFLTRNDNDSAFGLLSKMSQDTNRKLRDVAIVVAECAAAGEALPPDLSASWRAHTCRPGSVQP